MSALGPDAARELVEPGDTDAVTFAWADRAGELYGLARLGRGAGADGTPTASALAVLFSGRAPAGARARGGWELPPDATWEHLAVPGLAVTTEAPMARWTVTGDGELTFRLRFEATGPPAAIDPGSAVEQAGGMAGYEQLCRVSGSVRVGGRDRAVDGVGQRSHAWGNPDWDAIALTRTLGIWLGDGTGLSLASVRPAGATGHAEEARWAALLAPDGTLPVAEPRLSTTADADGRQRRAGLELWLSAHDEEPRRAAGEVLCGSTLELGALRMDCAIFQWHMEGRPGIGRYDVLRRA